MSYDKYIETLTKLDETMPVFECQIWHCELVTVVSTEENVVDHHYSTGPP